MSRGNELIQQLLGGYFHQDWDLEANDDLGVVRRFIEDVGGEKKQSILDAIDQVLLEDEAKVSSFLSESGCEYYFAGDGLTAKGWLMRLRSEFDAFQSHNT